MKSPQETFKIHMMYRSFLHNKKFLEGLVHSAKKQHLMLEEQSKFNFAPVLNLKSRFLAEQQFNQISQELSKHNVHADYEDLLIKKGEIYKEHIGKAR